MAGDPKPESDAGEAARDLGQPEGSEADPAAAEPTKTPRNPDGLSSGLQPGGTIPGQSPAAGAGSIGTGGGSTGGASTGPAKRGS